MNVCGSDAGDNYHYSITTLSLLLPLASIFQDIPPQRLKKMLQYCFKIRLFNKGNKKENEAYSVHQKY
jgi:hypothetical protein